MFVKQIVCLLNDNWLRNKKGGFVRVKRGFKARKFRKKILKRAKGFYSANSRCFSVAIEKVDRALSYQYRDRRTKKRQFRRLWIQRINGAARLNGTTYSSLMNAIRKKEIPLDRKVLADLAVLHPKAFSEVVKTALQ